MRTRTSPEQRTAIAAGLREWAKGLYSLEAAVELLIRFNRGRLLTDVWIQQDDTMIWFAPIEAPMSRRRTGLSGGEHRVLMIACSLAEPGLDWLELGEAVTSLDRDALDLVLAAIAHAGGSHEHSRPVFGLDGTYAGNRELPALHEWPQS